MRLEIGGRNWGIGRVKVPQDGIKQATIECSKLYCLDFERGFIAQIFELPVRIMRHITKIDINESVSRNKLIFQEEWLDKFDRFAVYIFFSGLIIYPALTIFEADFNNPNDKFISLTILPLCILFGLYVVYRKATEKLLFTLTTPFDRQKNKQILLTYAGKQQLEVYRKSNDCLILNESLGGFNPSYKKSMVFIIKDNQVLFTILKDQYKLNLPTLTSHLFLKHDLKKLFNNVTINDSGAAAKGWGGI